MGYTSLQNSITMGFISRGNASITTFNFVAGIVKNSLYNIGTSTVISYTTMGNVTKAGCVGMDNVSITT